MDPEGEVMVYPELDVPMYEPLKDLSSELFLPNIQLIENDTITLLETNQKFIEAYMVGLNHEMSRELLWREYPTDQRGSYFRQFWDASSFLVQGGGSEEETRERLRDITKLHTWRPNESLDDHDNREAHGDKEEELVLVIRGELFKKYPNAIIYAHRANWERVGDVPTGAIDKSRPRRLRVLTAQEEASELRRYVKTPLYDAAVAPDIYFFGFDLTADRGAERCGSETAWRRRGGMVLRHQGAARRAALRPRHRRHDAAGVDYHVESAGVERRRHGGRRIAARGRRA